MQQRACLQQLGAPSRGASRPGVVLIALLASVACAAQDDGAPTRVETQSQTGDTPSRGTAGTDAPAVGSNASGTPDAAAGDAGDAAAPLDCSLESSDAGGCRVARTLLACTSSDYRSLCLADDDTPCDGAEESAACENLCPSDEYAMACGTIGPPAPGSTPQTPPEGCRSAALTPGGIGFYCCPCG